MALITFGAKSTEQILSGKKTLTFRKWPTARVKVGEVCDAARMGFPPRTFAKVKVTGLGRVKLKDIDEKLAQRDGAGSAAGAQAYWRKQGFKDGDELWMVEFELVSAWPG